MLITWLTYGVVISFNDPPYIYQDQTTDQRRQSIERLNYDNITRIRIKKHPKADDTWIEMAPQMKCII